jgi:plasmid stabilization system protein ParE
VIIFNRGALDDLERIFDYNFARNPETARAHLDRIRHAVLILDAHPHIGRRMKKSTLRELVISHGSSGYVALYKPSPGLIRIVAVRHQREAGYRD